ncbi:unnamed protein product [Callosobruchus maculatus]|uniref:Uncharacterized protein n=1 Tax=Callosobruchus maculatus TaxID=64391 RepID=A0A653DRC7_CALMS|nr:unnamed protein product [Callosobruchus maculatus]
MSTGGLGQLKTQCDEEKENHIPDIHLTLPGQEIVDILVVDEVPQTCPRPDDCIEEQAITDTPSTSKTWESYTPQHLRTPRSKKLRLNRGHTKSLKDKFCEKKIMFAEEEIKRSQLEQEEILLKRQRDMEEQQERMELLHQEHQKRMELLNLEIEIKKSMLQQ